MATAAEAVAEAAVADSTAAVAEAAIAVAAVALIAVVTVVVTVVAEVVATTTRRFDDSVPSHTFKRSLGDRAPFFCAWRFWMFLLQFGLT